MLLALDIGNTDMVFGVHDGDNWKKTWRIPSSEPPAVEVWQFRLINELLELGLTPASIQGSIISSVVPALTPPAAEMLTKDLPSPPIVMGPDIFGQLPIDVGKSKEIGTDLVANACAAYNLFRQTTIIVDFGTALTFTTLSETGNIVGVAIAPGLKTAVRSLFSNTAQLPEVPLEVPESALGKDTVHAIQAGVVLGYTGMVSYLIEKIKSELSQPCKIVATGGLSWVLTPLKEVFHIVDPMLTMNGLELIFHHLSSKD